MRRLYFFYFFVCAIFSLLFWSIVVSFAGHFVLLPSRELLQDEPLIFLLITFFMWVPPPLGAWYLYRTIKPET